MIIKATLVASDSLSADQFPALAAALREHLARLSLDPFAPPIQTSLPPQPSSRRRPGPTSRAANSI